MERDGWKYGMMPGNILVRSGGPCPTYQCGTVQLLVPQHRCLDRIEPILVPLVREAEPHVNQLLLVSVHRLPTPDAHGDDTQLHAGERGKPAGIGRVRRDGEFPGYL